MNFLPTKIPDVIVIQPKIYQDDRGFFMETYQKNCFEKNGIDHEFVQDNHSSSRKFTLRGLHYQVSHTQGKLVRAVIGEIFDVAVDLRKGSKYFGKWVGLILSEKNKKLLWIPPGFAHGFFTLTDRADVVYKATDFYDPSGDRGVRWNDPALAIDWPIPENVTPVVSIKDSKAPLLKDAEIFE